MYKNVREFKYKIQNPAMGIMIKAINIAVNSENDQRKLWHNVTHHLYSWNYFFNR